ncbi:GTPase HflX [Clostridia bacterium]|nr:GTPase HflX [Clostridia bacterium]
MDSLKDISFTAKRAVMVGLACGRRGFDSDEESLDELTELLRTCGVVAAGRALQNRDVPDPRFLIGAGKVEEVRGLAVNLGAEAVVFDNELSPSQLGALSDALNMYVTDRSGVILEIFSQRAQSGEGRLQVELATLKYLLPRLTGHGVDLSRMGGQLRARGPGETKLETDRRHIRVKVARLERELKEVRRARDVQRSRRLKNDVPLISLVGYTNAGKSTLMNALTDAGTQANDQLFDTLDTVTRRVAINGMPDALLSDTVGFIRRLPTPLIDAFRATLEELTFADLLLHVIDASAHDRDEKAAVVDHTLDQLGLSAAPVLRVFNKNDLAQDFDVPMESRSVAVSAISGQGLEELRARIAREIGSARKRVRIGIPYAQYALIDSLYQRATVHGIEYTEDNILADVTCDRLFLNKLQDDPLLSLSAYGS